VFGERGSIHDIIDFDGKKVHHDGDGRGGHGHEESVQVRLELVGAYDEKLLDSMILPFREKLVHGAVKGLSLEPCRPSETLFPRAPNPVVERGGEERLAATGCFIGCFLRNEGVGSKREMGPMLDQCSHRNDQPWVPGEDPSHFRPREVLEGP